MCTDDGGTTEASHPISSPRAFGSGELKAEYRKIDPNRSLEVKANSHVFLICIGHAEIKHVFGWCTDR